MKKLILNFKSKDSKKIKNSKNFLGGKGANLSEMGRMGLPVPPGFTISTKVCDLFYKDKKKLNKNLITKIKKEIGEDVMASYKRASSILESELKNTDLELSNTTDPGIFKNDYEKNLLKKINELRKYFTNINKDENYMESLTNLAGAKKVVFDFFNNVKVNDEDKNIKKNRLELLQMLCRTFDNFVNFSNIETK